MLERRTSTLPTNVHYWRKGAEVVNRKKIDRRWITRSPLYPILNGSPQKEIFIPHFGGLVLTIFGVN